MKAHFAGLAAVAVAAFLSVPAMAQTSGGVTSSTGIGVSSGTGSLVGSSSGPASASVTVIPQTSVAVPSANLLPGGAMVQRSSTTVLGGPAGGVSGTQSVVTDYWVNVPAGADHRADFHRWQSLR